VKLHHSTPFIAEVNSAWVFTPTTPYVFTAWCLVKHDIDLHGIAIN
jgi:hypothetical protein